MTNNKRRPDPLANLEDWLDEETLSMPIEEVKEELRALGDDPDAVAAHMRKLARSIAERDRARATGETSVRTPAPDAKPVPGADPSKHAQAPVVDVNRARIKPGGGVQSAKGAQPGASGSMKMAAKGEGGGASDPLGAVFEKDIVINGHKFSASVPPTRQKHVVLRGAFFDPAWKAIRVAGVSYALEEIAPKARRCVELKKLRFDDALKEHKSGKAIICFE